MAEVNYQRAVQVLQDRIGTRWAGAETAGRDEMINVLKNEFGYDNRQAHDTIDAMIKAGTLRYHRATSDPNDTSSTIGVGPVAAPAGSSGQAGAPTIAGFAGAPAVDPIAGVGYWQIGQDLGEGGGRMGQVTPT